MITKQYGEDQVDEQKGTRYEVKFDDNSCDKVYEVFQMLLPVGFASRVVFSPFLCLSCRASQSSSGTISRSVTYLDLLTEANRSPWRRR